MRSFWEIVFCVPLLFRCHVCLSDLKHAPSLELPLTARKTVFKVSVYFIPLKLTVNLLFTFLLITKWGFQLSLKILRSMIYLGSSSWHYRIINNLGLISDSNYFRTFKAKWCVLMFSLNSSGLMSLFEVNNSHQRFPSAPLEAARFRDKHDGLLRHSKVQSKVSYTVKVPIPGTFKKWFLSFTKTSWRWAEWCVECDSIIIKKIKCYSMKQTIIYAKNRVTSSSNKNIFQMYFYLNFVPFIWNLYLLKILCKSLTTNLSTLAITQKAKSLNPPRSFPHMPG